MRIDSKISLDQVTMFGDAIFAFSITIMALSFDVPSLPSHLTESQAFSELLKILPQLEIYFISFMVIGIFWVKYHAVFNQIKDSHAIIIWLNLLFLFMITIVSYGTALHMENPDYQVVFMVYAVILTATGALLFLIWMYAERRGLLLVENHHSKKLLILNYLRSLITPLVFGVSIAVSYIDIFTAQMFWFTIFPLQIALNKQIKKG